MASTVNMGDPKTESQLVSGFYGVESGAWRWTAKQFSVVLHPPSGSDQKGAKLQLKLTVPSIVIERLKAISLSAAVNGGVLPAETYSRPGGYLYARNKGIDLIVMSTHGRTGVSRALLGSVAEAVVRLSPCLVLTVPMASAATAQ